MKKKDHALEESLLDKNRFSKTPERDLPIDDFDNEEDLLYLGTQPRSIQNQNAKDQVTPNFSDHVSRIHYESDEVPNTRLPPSPPKPTFSPEPRFPSEVSSSLEFPSPTEPPLPLISLSQGLTASQLPASTAPITRNSRGVARKKIFQQENWIHSY